MAWPFWLARFGPALGKILWERSKKLLGSALTKWEYKRIALQIGRQAKKNKWSAKRIQEEVEKYYKEIKQGKDWHTNVKDLKPDDYVELFWEDPLGLEEGRQVEEGPTDPDGVILYGSWSKEDLLDWVSDWKDLKVKGDIVEGMRMVSLFALEFVRTQRKVLPKSMSCRELMLLILLIIALMN